MDRYVLCCKHVTLYLSLLSPENNDILNSCDRLARDSFFSCEAVSSSLTGDAPNEVVKSAIHFVKHSGVSALGLTFKALKAPAIF